MDSNSNYSILNENKAHITTYEHPVQENSLNNSDVNNYFESNVNNEKTRLIINQESTSYNSICSINFSNSNKSNISSKFYQIEKSKLKNNYRIICKNCNNFTQIVFNENITLNILCDCKKIENMEYNYFIHNYIVKNLINNGNESKIIVDNYCLCEIHYKPYNYFCEDCSKNYNKICGRNLCDDCIREKNLHSNHKIFSFDNNMLDNIQNITKFIKRHNQKKVLNDSEDEKLYKYFGSKFEEFLTILKMILISSQNYFCYKVYKTIILTKNFLDNIKCENTNINKNEIIIFSSERIQKHLINIKEKNEFIYIKNDKYHNRIKSIEIIKKNFNNINILNNTNLINLETLSLPDNNITDLTPLKNISAQNLKNLNLSTNKLTDENIPIINSMDFPNLIFINFARNYFHNFNIFKCFKKFKRLDTLYIGTNKFDIFNENDIYDMQNFKELSLSKGVFSDINIKIISNFNFQNLVELHVSGNNLNSLAFLYNLNCSNLTIFCGYSNNFKDFWPLIKFSKLSIIYLQNNPINDISKLDKFVLKLKKLSMIELSETLIDKNDENLEIIKNIKQSGLDEGRDIKILI